MEKFVILSLVGLVSIIATRLVSRRSENLKHTMDLFRHYHSHDLLVARNKSWQFLKVAYLANPVSFDELFSDRVENSEIYDHLAKVIYFWMSLCVLNMESGISKKIACRLFSKQYKDWESAFRPLYEKTKEKSDYAPDWFMLFENNRMNWLKVG